ncbi:MAG TPA: hypothetical protein VF024_00390, partial [Solirubrobacteraceae bacterium]
MIDVRHGGPDDAAALLALFDDAVAWLVARGQTAQWGEEPWSARESAVERARVWAAGGGLRLATDPRTGAPVGALVVGAAQPYVPPSDVPELYVVVLLTAAAWRGRGVGARLIGVA